MNPELNPEVNPEPTAAYLPPIDYLTRWRELVRARADQGKRLDPTNDRPDQWAGPRAARFRRLTGAAGPDPLVELIRPSLRSDATVLDVGAGAGRHVARLAPLVSKVTAVEPSPAMREQLSQVVEEAGLTNVEIVPGRWPDVDVAPADVVVCSHVTYFTDEIGTFLKRLRAVNRGRAYVVHRHLQREAALHPLFRQVWGEPRREEPSFADLFGAAAQIGLWANVATIPFGVGPQFASLDEAVEQVRADLLNPPESELPIIRAYLAANLAPRDGQLGFDRPMAYAGVLWWEAGI